jgi:molybdopterin/thiamine biosynthesis adenylyltransferase
VAAARELSRDEVERYGRQLILPGIGGAGQRRLAGAAVFVVGAGGLGSPLLAYLAAAGVGRLGIADPDLVERSNLGRQVLYGEADVGRGKAQAAAEALGRLNPHVRAEAVPERVEAGNVGRLSAGYGLLVDGSDSFAAKFAVNDEAVRSGRPCVVGAAVGYAGQLMAVRRGEGPCYRCLFEEEPPGGVAQSCQAAGILGAVTGVVGSLQAAEVLKLLLGLPVEAGLLQYDALAGSLRRVRFERREDCAACGVRS